MAVNKSHKSTANTHNPVFRKETTHTVHRKLELTIKNHVAYYNIEMEGLLNDKNFMLT